MKVKVILFLSLSLCSCSVSEKVSHQGVSLNIQNYESRATAVPIVSNLRYIPLETTPDCIIGVVTKVIARNGNFYVSDRVKKKEIIVFAEDGKFLYKIDKSGNGPGEYIQPSDFDVDESGNLYVYDDQSSRLIKYKDMGNTFEEFRMPMRFSGFSIFGKKVLMNLVRDNGARVVFHSALYDMETNKFIEKTLGRIGYDDLSIASFSFSRGFRSDKSVLFYKRFSNEIFRADGYDIKQVVNLEAAALPPLDFLENNKKGIELEADTKYIKDITELYENDDFFVFKLHQRRVPTMGVMSKQSGNSYFFKSFSHSDFFGAYGFYGTYKSHFFSIVPSSQAMYPNFKADVKKSGLELSEKEKLLSMNVESNPTIVVFDINPDLK